MVIHNSIPVAMPSQPGAFSQKRAAFFDRQNASIPGNISCFSPFSRLANLFPCARFFPIPTNSRQKAAYLARFV